MGDPCVFLHFSAYSLRSSEIRTVQNNKFIASPTTFVAWLMKWVKSVSNYNIAIIC